MNVVIKIRGLKTTVTSLYSVVRINRKQSEASEVVSKRELVAHIVTDSIVSD